VDGRDRDLLLANLGLPQLALMSPVASVVTPAPEPCTLALLAAALLSLLAFASRKRR
jgi:hypothetical protein